jgi:hypothetical protein
VETQLNIIIVEKNSSSAAAQDRKNVICLEKEKIIKKNLYFDLLSQNVI